VPAAADPLTDGEFADLVAPCGPFGERRNVAVAVSGGADSMALAWLLRRWGDPLAIVIDHGMRPVSADEAAVTMERLAALAIPACLITLAVPPGPDAGARARAARYTALLAACRLAGRPDLFVGHHRQDQAETMLLRAAAGSGPAGLAGMAAIAWRGDARLVRPLLAVPPARLRATLVAAGIGWVDDPCNSDPASARGALRTRGVPDAAADSAHRAITRRAGDAATAAELACHVEIYPAGYAQVHGRLSEDAWSALVWTISGRPYPPRRAAIRQLISAGGGTVHGVQLHNGRVVREPASVMPPVPATPGATWDGRFVVRQAPPAAAIAALGNQASRLRRRPGLPSLVMRGLPAVSLGAESLVVPHLAYAVGKTCPTVQVDFRPPRPLAGAPFGG
jgi:tRNA(Ile)-lysidine synthase